jgi:hypothetical protein
VKPTVRYAGLVVDRVELSAVFPCAQRLPFHQKSTLCVIRAATIDQWRSTPPEVISLQLCTPEVLGVKFKLYTPYNLYLK